MSSVLVLVAVWPGVVASLVSAPGPKIGRAVHLLRGPVVVVSGSSFDSEVGLFGDAFVGLPSGVWNLGSRGRRYEMMAVALGDDDDDDSSSSESGEVSPAALAADGDQWDVVEWLVKKKRGYGIEIDGRYKGRTAMDYAIVAREHGVVKLLLSRAADPNLKSRGVTPLSTVVNHREIYSDHHGGCPSEIMALYLLEAGADPDEQNPLGIAVKRGHTRIMDLLVGYGASPTTTANSKSSKSSAGDDTLSRKSKLLKVALEKGDHRTALALAAADANTSSSSSSLDALKLSIHAQTTLASWFPGPYYFFTAEAMDEARLTLIVQLSLYAVLYGCIFPLIDQGYIGL